MRRRMGYVVPGWPWVVLLLISTTLSATDAAPKTSPVAPRESRERWQPATADPTIPLLRTFASRESAVARPLSAAQPYRFGDASYLQFREELQNAGGALTEAAPQPEK
jgi:hypothetical protein